MIQRRFIDYLDADRAAFEFLRDRSADLQRRGLVAEVRWHPHANEGRTGTLWLGSRIDAMVMVVRDQRGRTLLTTVELPGPATEAAAHAITQLPAWPGTPPAGSSNEYDRGFRDAVLRCESALIEALKPESLAQTLSSSLHRASAPEQTALAKQMTVFWRRLWRRHVPIAAKA